LNRQNNESILTLKQLLPKNQKVPVGLISKGPEAIKKAIADFESAKAFDAKNEKHPEAKKVTKKEKRGSRRFSKSGKMSTSSQSFKPMSVDIVIEEEGKRAER